MALVRFSSMVLFAPAARVGLQSALIGLSCDRKRRGAGFYNKKTGMPCFTALFRAAGIRVCCRLPAQTGDIIFFHFNFVRLKVSFVTLRFLGELLSGNRFSWCNPGYVLQRLAGLKTHFPAGTSTGTTGSSLQITRDTTVHRP
jgi:hypothetical protein